MAETKNKGTEQVPDIRNASVYRKLQYIQLGLKSRKLNENSDNEQNVFRYRTVEQIYAEAKPFLKETDTVMFFSETSEILLGKVYIHSTVSFVDLNKPEDRIAVTALAGIEDKGKGGMDASQLTGSATSYARKYALQSLFLLDDNEDPDAPKKKPEEASKEQKEPPKPVEKKQEEPQTEKKDEPKAQPEKKAAQKPKENLVIGKPDNGRQMKEEELLAMFSDENGLQRMLNAYGVNSVGELSDAQLDDAIAKMTAYVLKHSKKKQSPAQQFSGALDSALVDSQ